MNTHKETMKVVAKMFGHSVEETKKIIAEQEKRSTETVRLLSMHDVREALSGALVEVLGDLAILVGPDVMEKVIRELFFKQEGE